MKSEKGITLVSITIYIIVMTLLVAVITIITNYFYKNISLNNEKDDINKQYTKFISYFSEEVNKEDNEILEVNTDMTNPDKKVSYILFSSGNQYTFMKENNGIYQGNVKIATNITDCTFEKLSPESIKISIRGEPLFYKENTFNMKK